MEGLEYTPNMIEHFITEKGRDHALNGHKADPSSIVETIEVGTTPMMHKTMADLLKEFRPFPELKKEIETAIDSDGEIKDTASKKLRSIPLKPFP